LGLLGTSATESAKQRAATSLNVPSGPGKQTIWSDTWQAGAPQETAEENFFGADIGN
jgi:hypothetical protein